MPAEVPKQHWPASNVAAELVPDFLVVGHVTHDRQLPVGHRPGGAAYYASLIAKCFVPSVGVVTSAGPDFKFAEHLGSVTVISRLAPQTTTFQNVEVTGGRRQRLLARAADLLPEDLPQAWRQAPIVLLAPLACEVPVTMIDLFPNSLVGVAAQGWLRSHYSDGWIEPRPLPFDVATLARCIVFVSDEDLGRDEAVISAWAKQLDRLVVTRGAGGATVYQHSLPTDVPVPKVVTGDTTGAGDVFAAVFLLALGRGFDPLAAAGKAHRAAGLTVETQYWTFPPLSLPLDPLEKLE